MDDKNSIKEILERASSGGNPPSDDAVEFEYAERTSVIFETEDSAVEKEEATAPETFEFAEDAVSDDAVSGETKGEDNDGAEFVLPDIFDIEEKSRELDSGESGIWTTYVPRFTEVSENYRMRGAATPDAPRVSVQASEGEEENTLSAIDPTSEIASGAENVRVVNVDTEGGGKSEETKTVYKFSDSTAEKPQPKIRTLEDEVREIDELMSVGKKENDEPIAEAVTVGADEKAAGEQPSREINSTISDSAVREANPDKYSYPERAESAAAELPAEAPKRLKSRDFAAPPQRDGFKDRFLDQLLSIKVRLGAAAILTLAILLFENLHLTGVDLLGTLKIPKFTGIPALLDLQLAACVFLLALPEMIVAVSNLVRGKVTSELSVILSLCVLVAYSVTVYALQKTDYALFGFLFAVHAVAAVAASYFKKRTDFSSFKLISGKEKKRALVITPTRELVMENMALDGAVDEYKSQTVHIKRTAFVSDFFKRSGDVAEENLTTVTMMGISLGAALVCGVVSYFLYDGAFSFVTAMALVFLMAMPAFSVLTYKFVYSHAASCAKKDGFAVIGQGALSEYADADVVVFEDVEIFSEDDVKLRNFYGDMTKGMRQMCAIFGAVGGPLEKIFSSALDRKCSPASSVVIESDGISGKVDGKLVYAGTEAYMLRHGASFESESVRTAMSVADSSKIMFAAEDGVIYASFRISYSFSESFTMVLPSLKAEKIVPLIVTRDPNITNELIKTLTMGSDAIRVLKKTDVAPAFDNIERRASAGLVGVGERPNVLNAMLLSKKSAALSSRLALTEIMALAVGAALGAALSLGGMTQAPTVALGMWQLLWCVGVGFLSYREYKQE